MIASVGINDDRRSMHQNTEPSLAVEPVSGILEYLLN